MRTLLKMPGIFSVLFASLLALSAHGQIASFCGGSPPTSVDVRNDADAITPVGSPSYQGGSSLKFELNTNSSTTEGWGSGHDRCEARVMSCGTNSMFSNMRYAGFMLYLDNNVDGTNASESYEILMQWRQCSGPASPPITIQIEEDGSNVDLLLAVRTDDDPIEGRHNTASYTKKVSVQKGTWYQITLGALVKPAGGGQVKWWIDGTLEADYSGKVGRSDLVQNMEIKYGLYRGPTYPISKGAETLYFDQIAYGTSYNDVQPGHCAAGSFPDLTKWYFIESVAYPGERIKAQSSTTDLRRQSGSTDSRQWKFVSAGTGYYYLESKSHPGERIKAQSSSVNLRRQAGTTDDRKWKLVDAGSGSYYIESKQYAGERIKAQSSTTTLRRQAGSTNSRKWKFIEAGAVARLAPEGFDDLVVQKDVDFILYPNPVVDQLTIKFTSDKMQSAQYRLLDMMGRQVLQISESVGKGAISKQLDVSKLQKGMYILSVKLNGEMQTRRIAID
ncbi:MAG: heparin lyase I family protein [Cyclobacteriaceae bacterium]|nr:heparin lyase I family protein [Cyclobacteriaceae bacterium HetDA_MAG_MS6]